jgi:hypothetical protein
VNVQKAQCTEAVIHSLYQANTLKVLFTNAEFSDAFDRLGLCDFNPELIEHVWTAVGFSRCPKVCEAPCAAAAGQLNQRCGQH